MAAQRVTIWHNPKCGTSRKVLEMIRAAGIEPTIVDYVNNPPSVAEIKSALAEMASKPRDLLRRISFIKMYTSLHGRNGHAACVANHHLTGMANCGGARERRNLIVRHTSRVCQGIGKAAKTGTQDQTNARTQRCFCQDEFRGGFGAQEDFIHFRLELPFKFREAAF